MATITIKLKGLHSYQAQIKAHPARFKVVACGRRFGKTVLGEDEASHAILRGEKVGWFAPDYKKLAEVYRFFEKTFGANINRDQSTALIETSNKTEGRISFKTGGEIEFWSLTDPDCGRSRDYDLVIIDEAGLCLELADRWREAIRATLMDRQGKAYFLGTPKPPKSIQLKDYAFYLFFQRGLDEENKSWQSFHAPSNSNPTLKPEEIEEMRNEPGMTKRIARQEIDAEFLAQNEGALWSLELIENNRRQVPKDVKLLSIVLFLDPGNITSESTADMTGIVIAGKGDDGHYYVLNDLTGNYTPNKMATLVVNAADKYGARVYFESNQGGEYIKHAIRSVSPISVIGVPSTKGKEQRAMAPLGLYEMGFVHHVAEFVDMENEMLGWNPFDTKMKSPNRMDALVGAINVLSGKGVSGVRRTNRLKKAS